MINMTKTYVNRLSREIIGAAIEVHKELGPGLLESVYEKCLIYVLEEKGHYVETQIRVPISFRGMVLDADLKLDILINDTIIAELKTVDNILPVHEAQLLTYLKLLQKPKGILINFKCANIFNNGQRTFLT